MMIQKKTLAVVKLLLIVAMLQSCTTFTEEIFIEKDGSGSYVFYTDMIPFMKNMAFQMDKMFKENDSTAVPETDEERMARIEKDIWKDFPDNIDSTFSMADGLSDSVKQDAEIMKYLENAEGFMEGGKSKGYVYMGFKFKYSDLSELQKFMKVMKESERQDGNQNEIFSGLNNSIEQIEYSFDDGVFSKKIVLVEKDTAKNEGFQMFEAMIGATVHKEIIHLPGEISKVEGRVPKTVEGNTVIFEDQLSTWLNEKFKGDYKVYVLSLIHI